MSTTTPRIIELHAIQEYPPAVLNRDDHGSPKTAEYGGVLRGRISSQSLKRAGRLMFDDHLRGERIRTDRLGERLLGEVRAALGPDVEVADSDLTDYIENACILALSGADAYKKAVKTTKDRAAKAATKGAAPEDAEEKEPEEESESAGSGESPKGVMTLFSAAQLASTAALIARWYPHEVAGTRSTFTAEFTEAMNSQPTLDLAAYGRMTAGNRNIAVDAACHVAHAISVHEATPEFDYFTAVEDGASGNGAGYVGATEFMSSTMYRYMSISVDDLSSNLHADEDDLRVAIAELVRAFVLAVPSAKQATYASATRPALVVAVLREASQPVSWASAFERPIRGGANGYVEGATAALVDRVVRERAAYGEEDSRALTLIASRYAQAAEEIGPSMPLNDLITQTQDFAVRAD